MINTVKKALEHLEFRFTKTMKPTENDIDAYNILVEFKEKQHKEQVNNNQLFGKLFIKYYIELLKYYNTTVFDSEPRKEINRILDTSIHDLIKEFVKEVNTQELYFKMRENGFKDIHPREMKEEDRNKIKFDIKWLYEKEITIEEATDNLKSMINKALDRYK